MNPVSIAELNRMRGVQVGTFRDTCILQTYTETVDAVGQPILTYIDGAPEACRFDPLLQGSTPREHSGADGTLTQIEAILHLPVGRAEDGDNLISILFSPVSSVDVNDSRYRIKITHRNYEELEEPEVFEIVGLPKLGNTFVQVNLRKRRR